MPSKIALFSTLLFPVSGAAALGGAAQLPAVVRDWAEPLALLSALIAAGLLGYGLGRRNLPRAIAATPKEPVAVAFSPSRDDRERERDRLKAELNRLRQLEAIRSEGVETMAHDLMNPLGNVLELVRELTLSVRSGSSVTAIEAARREEALGQVAHCGRYMLELLRDFMKSHALEHGRIEISPEPNDLLDVAREIAALNRARAAAKKIEIRVTGERGARASIDIQRTLEALDNVVNNAIKFSPPGSRVGIDVAAIPETGRVRITVTDGGPGLSPDDLPQLFQKFRRLSAEPTAGESCSGLGLAIARRLVELQGGTIGAHNHPSSGGAVFFVEFGHADRRSA